MNTSILPCRWYSQPHFIFHRASTTTGNSLSSSSLPPFFLSSSHSCNTCLLSVPPPQGEALLHRQRFGQNDSSLGCCHLSLRAGEPTVPAHHIKHHPPTRSTMPSGVLVLSCIASNRKMVGARYIHTYMHAYIYTH